MKDRISSSPEISPVVDSIVSDCDNFGISAQWVKQQIMILLPFLIIRNAARITGTRNTMIAVELKSVWEQIKRKIEKYAPYDIANIRSDIAVQCLEVIKNFKTGNISATSLTPIK